MNVESILNLVISELLGLLPPEKVRDAADKLLDKIEDAIAKSQTKLDDAIALPIIKKILREPFGIEDKDVK